MRSVHSSNLELLPYFQIGRLSCLERRVPYTFRNNHEFSDSVFSHNIKRLRKKTSTANYLKHKFDFMLK